MFPCVVEFWCYGYVSLEWTGNKEPYILEQCFLSAILQPGSTGSHSLKCLGMLKD